MFALWIVLLVLIAVIFAIVKTRKTTTAGLDKGAIGEKRVNDLLNTLGKDYTVYHDLYVKKPDGTTSQIDHVVLSPFGIFVIETKNFRGWIYGEEHEKHWTQIIYKTKNQFYNPILQNRAHVRALQHYLGIDMIYYSIITFSDAATLKFDADFSEAAVINNTQLIETMKKFRVKQLSHVQQQAAREKLHKLVITDKKLKKRIMEKHIEHIQLTIPNKTSPRSTTKKACQKCDHAMELKYGKYGRFYGCSNYPVCRYTERVEELARKI